MQSKRTPFAVRPTSEVVDLFPNAARFGPQLLPPGQVRVEYRGKVKTYAHAGILRDELVKHVGPARWEPGQRLQLLGLALFAALLLILATAVVFGIAQ